MVGHQPRFSDFLCKNNNQQHFIATTIKSFCDLVIFIKN